VEEYCRSQDLRYLSETTKESIVQDFGMPRPTLGGGRLEQGWCSEAPPQLSPGFLVRHRTTVYGTRDPGLADPRQPLYPRKGTLFFVYFSVLHPLDADPYPAFHFDADPNPAFHSDADPDPTFNSDADPDPAFHTDADPEPTFHSDADADLEPTCQFDVDPDPGSYHSLVAIPLKA
jgi:hypothetical protein